MTSINPIRLGITGSQYEKPDVTEDSKQKRENKNKGAQKKELSGSEVLSFLAAQNADFIPAKAARRIDVSKYVNAEQQARIEGMMKDFEANYEDAFQAATNEFPELSKNAASDLALAWAEAN